LAQISGVLGKHNISIASVYQHDSDLTNSGVVPLVIVTKESAEKNASLAVAEIENLDCVAQVAERLRILD
jgi:homoserine dehydrogenase